MNQIAIGSYSAEGDWLVLHGEEILTPFKKSNYQPVFVVGEEVSETIRVSLEGSPDELADGIRALETIRQRNLLYHQTGYPAPQYLRFQLEVGGPYYYSQLRTFELEANADAVTTRQTGSLVLTLHITRPNYYDGEQVELPLTGHDVTDALGGVDLVNHTDSYVGPGNSVLIASDDFQTDLPAPLRMELINTDEEGRLHDIFTGIYHHPESPPESLFFFHAVDFSGGLRLTTSAAINGNFTRVSWDETDWQSLGFWYLSTAIVEKLAGMWYRPILRFFTPIGYEDLYLQIKVQVGTAITGEAESISIDPDYGYALFPPLQIPPNQLMNEVEPHHVHLMLYGQHGTAATYEVDFDCLTLLPLEPGANFLAFYGLTENARLLDDNFLDQQVTRFTPEGSEVVVHIRQGDRLTLFPGHYHRMIVILTDEEQEMAKSRTANLRLYYRPRKRML